jgi:hypothetical protein
MDRATSQQRRSVHGRNLSYVNKSVRKRKKLVRIFGTFFPHYNGLSPTVKL